MKANIHRLRMTSYAGSLSWKGLRGWQSTGPPPAQGRHLPRAATCPGCHLPRTADGGGGFAKPFHHAPAERHRRPLREDSWLLSSLCPGSPAVLPTSTSKPRAALSPQGPQRLVPGATRRARHSPDESNLSFLRFKVLVPPPAQGQ